MSMNDATMAKSRYERPMRRPSFDGAACRRVETPIVPKTTIAGRALTAVVAIMTFLASLTTGAVMLVRVGGGRLAVGGGARSHHPGARRCPAATSRPMSPRRRHRPRRRRASPRCGPIPRRNRRACSSPGSAPGLRSTICRCRASSWCGLRPARRPTSRNCARRWPTRCRRRPSTIIAASSTACAPWCRRRSLPPAWACSLLVLIATMLSVTFATRGAMATNRPVIEVLHFIGAKDSFIAGHIQRHFLVLGPQGRPDRRRRRHAAVRARRPRQPLARRHARPATSLRPCSAASSIGWQGYVAGAGAGAPGRAW